MGFFFTFAYLVTLFVTPEVLFGPLHVYHLELLFAILAFVTTLPALPGTKLLEQPQTWAMLTLWALVPVSVALNTSIMEGLGSFYSFLPEIFAYFLVAVNFRTRRHYQLLIVALVLGSLYFIVHGALDLHNNVTPSLYLYGDIGLRRLRGLGVINDPNDFSQIMLSLIPCVFLLRRKSSLLNIFALGIPVLCLLVGMFLSHSRGAAVGLMAVIILASRRKIGTIPAFIVAGALFAVSLAFGWSGGRDVSVEAGSDRLDAWVMGIEFIKAHPLLGIGKDRFGDLNYITAHNSIIQCAAENGFIGFTCWVLFLFSSMRTAARLSSPNAVLNDAVGASATVEDTPQNVWAKMLAQSRAQAPPVTEESAVTVPAVSAPAAPGWRRAEDSEITQDAGLLEIRSTARLLMLALTGFLTAGWFLSRALSPWIFMYGGMIVALERMAKNRGIVLTKDATSFLLRWSFAIAIALLVFVYVTLKIRAKLGQ